MKKNYKNLYELLSQDTNTVTGAWIYVHAGTAIIYIKRYFSPPIFCEKITINESNGVIHTTLSEIEANHEKCELEEIHKQKIKENPNYCGKILWGSYWGPGLP